MPPTLPPPPPPAQPAGSTFDFGRPFTYVFDDPRWLNKVLIGGLFYMAALLLVGIFFVGGYLARVVRNIVAGVETPLPEWDDIGGYFSEGLRLFAVGIVYALPLMLVYGVMVGGGALLGASGSEGMRQVSAGMMSCGGCLALPLGLVLYIFLPAAMLFTIVDQRFGAAFEFGRIWSFIRANAVNYLLAIVVYLIAAFAAQFGIILLCVGLFFTSFWCLLVAAHAFGQTYRLSLVK